VRGSKSPDQRGWRVPAPELERAVAIAARTILDDKVAILEALRAADMANADLRQIFAVLAKSRKSLLSEGERSSVLVELLDRATLGDDGIRVGLKLLLPRDRALGAAHKPLNLVRFVPLRLKRRGVEMRLILDGSNEPRTPDPVLLKAFARARTWFDELSSGGVRSLIEISRREGLPKRYVTRLTKLAFISPEVVQSTAMGESKITANLQMLMDSRIVLALDWKDQEELLN